METALKITQIRRNIIHRRINSYRLAIKEHTAVKRNFGLKFNVIFSMFNSYIRREMSDTETDTVDP